MNLVVHQIWCIFFTLTPKIESLINSRFFVSWTIEYPSDFFLSLLYSIPSLTIDSLNLIFKIWPLWVSLPSLVSPRTGETIILLMIPSNNSDVGFSNCLLISSPYFEIQSTHSFWLSKSSISCTKDFYLYFQMIPFIWIK